MYCDVYESSCTKFMSSIMLYLWNVHYVFPRQYYYDDVMTGIGYVMSRLNDVNDVIKDSMTNHTQAYVGY